MNGLCVYFLEAGYATAPVKIGVAGDIRARLRRLQTGSPLRLYAIGLIACGSRLAAHRTERELHELFASQRIRGEWFRPSPELYRLIESLRPGNLLTYPADQYIKKLENRAHVMVGNRYEPESELA